MRYRRWAKNEFPYIKIDFAGTLSRLVSKSVELTVGGLSRGILCGRVDASKAERCAGDAAATPLSSCGADNNGSKSDVPEELHEGASEAVESGVSHSCVTL